MKIGENIENQRFARRNKERIVTKLAEMSSSNEYAIEFEDLPEMFEYSALKDKINEALNEGLSARRKELCSKICNG
jgi:exopolyphosphatase/pppGpp-phosphohydrolase